MAISTQSKTIGLIFKRIKRGFQTIKKSYEVNKDQTLIEFVFKKNRPSALTQQAFIAIKLIYLTRYFLAHGGHLAARYRQQFTQAVQTHRPAFALLGVVVLF